MMAIDEVNMQQYGDAIIDISPAREKFFGCSGKMLLPSPATIEALLAKIPAHQLITTELLQSKLAAQFHVEVTCPVTTRKALQTIAKNSVNKIDYWRVLKKDGGLLAIFPGGVEGHAARLRTVGFTIDSKGKNPKVHNYKAALVPFD